MNAPATFHIVTTNQPGAVGIVQLHGDGAADVVAALTGKRPTARCVLAKFEDIDEGLIVALRDDWCQLMPHGGVRVMQRLAERLVELGAQPVTDLPARTIYPEATSDLEADMLLALSRAASPAAIPLLLAQPSLWNQQSAIRNPQQTLAMSDRLDHLIAPPTVALVGAANVGKSTLTNLVMGRAASIVADLPGTTRDWVGGMARLSCRLKVQSSRLDGDASPTFNCEPATFNITSTFSSLIVHWYDTPGLRESDDPIEQQAIAIARRAIAAADVLIAMRDLDTDFPPGESLPREPDILIVNKADLVETDDLKSKIAEHELPISALRGEGIDDLSAAIADSLGLADVPTTPLWAFSPTLRDLLASGDTVALRRYAGGSS